MNFLKRNWMRVWQAAFLLSATTWLFAPYLNNMLAERTTYISEYMIPGMPYAWLFRTGEFIAALLLLLMAAKVYAKYKRLTVPVGLLSLIGVIILIDLLVPATCTIVNYVCQETNNVQNFVHNLESIIGYAAFVGLGLWDSIKQKRTPSILFTGLGLVLGLFMTTGLADTYKLATVTQFSFQFLAVVWTAWFVATLFDKQKYVIKRSHVNTVVGFWVGLQGVLSLVVATGHIDLYSRHAGAYFGSNDVLIGSHGVIVGIILLYLSRQLFRGERRAWQLLLVLLGVEVVKYATVASNISLVLVTLLTFIAVFVARDFFNRGMVHYSWRTRTYDIVRVLIGAGIVIAVASFLITRTPLSSRVQSLFQQTHKTAVATHDFADTHIGSSVRARTNSVVIAAVCWFILWSLFRPAKPIGLFADQQEIEEAEGLLEHHSNSTEDLFKLWPEDKEYFWSKNRDGFIAYKVVGPVAFALADPIAPTKIARKKLLKEFIAFCQTHSWNACFVLVSEEAAPMYEKAKMKKMQIGASAVIDIAEYARETSTNKWWRWQRNKGRKMNYQYEILEPPHASDVMKRLKEISDEWLTRGGHQEESFAMGYFDEKYLQRCRIHILRNEAGEIVAFVNQMHTFNNQPQTTIDLIRFVSEEQNANNFLLYSMLLRLDEEGEYKYFDLGFVPLAQMRGKLANVARKLGANRYSAGGLEQFKGKFAPNWKPNFIAYDGDVADLGLIALNLEKAMKPNFKSKSD